MDSSVRRDVLAVLYENGRMDGIGELAREMAGPADNVERLEWELYHHHLPKLESAGLIAWDREGGEISQGKAWSEFESLLELFGQER